MGRPGQSAVASLSARSVGSLATTPPSTYVSPSTTIGAKYL